jgi:hypothetical protein
MVFGTMVFGACGGEARLPPVLENSAPKPGANEPGAWEPSTKTLPSPGPSSCGHSDHGLQAAARKLAVLRLDSPKLGTRETQWALRSSGSPYVWPRMWVGVSSDLETIRREQPQSRGTWDERCGIGEATSQDGKLSVVIVLHAIAKATLRPMPASVAVGEQVSFEADIAFPAKAARVVLLGPSGPPRTVPSTFDGKHVVARFPAATRGGFVAQLVVDTESGPAPVLESAFFADVAPSTEAFLGPKVVAPTAAAVDPEAELLALIASARTSGVLKRSPALDAVARAHTEVMLRDKNLAHVVGGKGPDDRVRAAGIQARVIGENVAFAGTVRDAHENLMASPSHRGNIVSEKFTEIGLAVLTDEANHVWVTEVFSGP